MYLMFYLNDVSGAINQVATTHTTVAGPRCNRTPDTSAKNVNKTHDNCRPTVPYQLEKCRTLAAGRGRMTDLCAGVYVSCGKYGEVIVQGRF